MKRTLISRFVSHGTSPGSETTLAFAVNLAGAASPREVLAVLALGWALSKRK